MKIIVADSCSLVLLAKCNLLGTLSGFFSVVIPNAVYREVVNKDTIERFPDARVISDLINEKKIEVAQSKIAPQRFPVALDKGEAEALLLAKQTPNAILATDDGKAIKACRYLNLPFIISPRIALELYRLDGINFDKTKSSIERMKIVGRYSSDIIAEAILELEVIRNAKAGNR